MLTRGSDKNMNCKSNKIVLSAAAINLKANQAPIRLMNKMACHTQTEVEKCLQLPASKFTNIRTNSPHPYACI